jgi:endonuclease/exonuclease/phosphatase family metal-dependent hydrolase
VISWNVWKRGGPWQRRHDLIAATLHDARPDLVTLQQTWFTRDSDQASQLADLLGLPHLVSAPYGPPASSPELEVRLAVLSRWPLREAVSRPLPSDGARRLGRIALGAIVDHPIGPVPVVTTHLNSDPSGSADRLREVALVAELTDELGTAAEDRLGPIVTGDLNAEPQSAEVRCLSALKDVWPAADDGPGWTWRRENAYLSDGTRSCRIDYILVGPAMGVLGVGLLGAAPTDGFWPSTHAAVVADLLL